MSRRTKLIITALFLVLLAIPVVYVVLTWSPKKPLRFRILSSVDGKPPPFNDLVTQFEVENTSAVPIYLFEARFFGPWKAGPPDAASLPSGWAQTATFHFDGVPVEPPAVIAPRSIFRYTTLLGRSERERIDTSRAEMVYCYRSETKHRPAVLYRRVLQYLPKGLARHLTADLYERDSTGIEQSSK